MLWININYFPAMIATVSLVGLIILLVVVAIVMAYVKMDPTLRKVIIVVIIVAVVALALYAFGVWPGGSNDLNLPKL